MTMESLPQDHPLRSMAMEAVQSRATRSHNVVDTAAARDGLIGFAYLRVSTKEQARTGGGAEGYSIPAQRDACLTKASQLGAGIEREYVDAGESARSADRAQLQQMLKDVKDFKPDFVLVHKI